MLSIRSAVALSVVVDLSELVVAQVLKLRRASASFCYVLEDALVMLEVVHMALKGRMSKREQGVAYGTSDSAGLAHLLCFVLQVSLDRVPHCKPGSSPTGRRVHILRSSGHSVVDLPILLSSFRGIVLSCVEDAFSSASSVVGSLCPSSVLTSRSEVL